MGACKEVNGDEHPLTLAAIQVLAKLYRDRGRLKEAEKLSLRVLESQRRVHGDDHHYTLITKTELAHIWHDQGRREEAEKLLQDCLRREKQALGESHPLTQASKNILKIFQVLQATLGS